MSCIRKRREAKRHRIFVAARLASANTCKPACFVFVRFFSPTGNSFLILDMVGKFPDKCMITLSLTSSPDIMFPFSRLSDSFLRSSFMYPFYNFITKILFSLSLSLSNSFRENASWRDSAKLQSKDCSAGAS